MQGKIIYLSAWLKGSTTICSRPLPEFVFDEFKRNRTVWAH